MATLRRYLSLCALLFWQGGFLFYAAVVIPAAGQVLGQRLLHLRAQITGQATQCLNGVGVAAVALLLWDLASSTDASRFRRLGRGASWAVMFLALAGLFALHYWLDVLDPPESRGPSDPVVFGVAHTLYVVVSVVQSAAALFHLGLAVNAWRAEDAKQGDKN